MDQSGWRNRTLAAVLDETVARAPDSEAIIFEKRRITFRELRENGVRLAKSFLKLGVQKGDKIGIWMPNSPEWIYARDAAIRAGAWWVPINSRFKSTELEAVLRHADIGTLVMTDRALGIDFVEILRATCPEVRCAQERALNLAAFPCLKNIICLGSHVPPSFYGFGEALDYGADIAAQSLEERAASIQPGDVVNITYSSGTTGVPKGVLLTHAQFLEAQAAMAGRLGTTSRDTLLMTAPLFTLMGTMTGVTHAQMYGLKMVLVESWNTKEVLSLIEKEQCSLFQGAPSMYRMLIDDSDFAPEKVRSMRAGSIGGAPFSPQLAQEIIDRMGIRLFSAYGMTENSGITTMSEPEDSPELVAHTVGKRIHEDVGMKVVDPATGDDLPYGHQGEVVTRGWFVTRGYYKNPDETARCFNDKGWFRTGDLGSVDERGYLRIAGRLTNLIISGGFNIVPSEIESVLLQHPAILHAEVVGIPDYRLGEAVAVFVQLKTGGACTEEEIVEFCASRVANYKVPKYVRFVEEFPVAAYGKVQKFKLRDMAMRRLGLELRTPYLESDRLRRD